MQKNVTIRVPEGMVTYLETQDEQADTVRNALILYPFIKNHTISHGRAAEILGISKQELIEMYDNLGLAYLSMDISEVEKELEGWEQKKGVYA